MEFGFVGTLICKKYLEGTSIRELTQSRLTKSWKSGTDPSVRYFILIPSALGQIDTEIVFSVNGTKVHTLAIQDTRIHTFQFPNVWSSEENNLEIEILPTDETWQVAIVAVQGEVEEETPDWNELSTFLKIAEVFYEKGHPVELEKLGLMSLEQNPKRAEGYLINAYLKEVQGVHNESFLYFQKAFEVDPDHNTARRHFGFVNACTGDFSEAKTILGPLLKNIINDYDSFLAWQYHAIILFSEAKILELQEHLKGIDSRKGVYAFHFLQVWKILLEIAIKGNTIIRPKGRLQVAIMKDITTFSVRFAVGAESFGKTEQYQMLRTLATAGELFSNV
ncbi:MAG: hypothetical protein RTV72_04400 [Candidatus Thorarchaeota archaeon]